MTRRTVARTTLALLAAVGAARAGEGPGTASAEAGRWRLVLGPSFGSSPFSTTYTSSYSPPLLLFAYESQATQVLPLEGGRGAGLRAALECRVQERWGLRLSADGVRTGLSGSTGSYDLTMHYTSRPPPSYDPVAVTLQRSEAQPPAEGHLDTLAVGLQLVAWQPLGPRARLGVAAGPAFIHTSGRAQSLVYTRYSLGGHSTPFYEDFLMSFDFPSSRLGAALGVFVEADLGRRLGLRLELGYLWGPEHDATVELRERVNSDQALTTPSLAEIEAGLAPAPVRVDPRLLHVSLALTIGL